MSLVVVPFGSIEHQARHLPVGADAIVADAVGREVAERLDAVLAPTVRVGYAEQHQQLAGTLTLLASTLADVAVELAQRLARHGFNIVLLSAHGGNAAAMDAAGAQLEAARPTAPLSAHSAAPSGRDHGRTPEHGSRRSCSPCAPTLSRPSA